MTMIEGGKKRQGELKNISVRISSKLNNLSICLIPTQPNPVQEPFKAEDFSKKNVSYPPCNFTQPCYQLVKILRKSLLAS